MDYDNIDFVMGWQQMLKLIRKKNDENTRNFRVKVVSYDLLISAILVLSVIISLSVILPL